MIRIKRLVSEKEKDRENPFERIHRYSVTENNRHFIILYKSSPHGHSLYMEDKKGVLYSDMEKNEVKRQVLSIGIDCGLRCESDETVDGLSPLALRGVVFAEKNHEDREITISEIATVDNKTEAVLSIDGVIVGVFDRQTMEIKQETPTTLTRRD